MVPRAKNRAFLRCRLLAGYTQEELAAAVHASRETINAIENDRAVPSVSLALAIATAVDSTVEELFAPRRTDRV